MSPEELTLEVNGKCFAARRWGRGATIRVLALHGWRDNCARIYFLAPLLGGCDLVAPDLAGHGLSDWRSADAPYTVWQDVGELLDIADQLGWGRFCLLGHSRGAAIATLLAGSHPGRIERLALLDNLFPAPVRAADAPAQLAAAIADRRALRDWKPRYHAGFDGALAVRTRGPLALPLEAARALALRGVAESPAGYYWRGDPRLGAASEVKFTEEHARAFVVALGFPVLLLLGRDSPIRRDDDLTRWSALNERILVREVSGGHHMHMDSGLAETAQWVAGFFGGGAPAA